jgi:hypothetical protein
LEGFIMFKYGSLVAVTTAILSVSSFETSSLQAQTPDGPRDHAPTMTLGLNSTDGDVIEVAYHGGGHAGGGYHGGVGHASAYHGGSYRGGVSAGSYYRGGAYRGYVGRPYGYRGYGYGYGYRGYGYGYRGYGYRYPGYGYRGYGFGYWPWYASFGLGGYYVDPSYYLYDPYYYNPYLYQPYPAYYSYPTVGFSASVQEAAPSSVTATLPNSVVASIPVRRAPIERLPVPSRAADPNAPSGTYPYDGGPRVPVPGAAVGGPSVDPQPSGDLRPVRLTATKKSLVYPAYGELSGTRSTTNDRFIQVRQTK